MEYHGDSFCRSAPHPFPFSFPFSTGEHRKVTTRLAPRGISFAIAGFLPLRSLLPPMQNFPKPTLIIFVEMLLLALQEGQVMLGSLLRSLDHGHVPAVFHDHGSAICQPLCQDLNA